MIWRRILMTVKGILLEITDQNAYRRHLRHHCVADSPEEWRRFSDAHWNASARRGRCC